MPRSRKHPPRLQETHLLSIRQVCPNFVYDVDALNVCALFHDTTYCTNRNPENIGRNPGHRRLKRSLSPRVDHTVPGIKFEDSRVMPSRQDKIDPLIVASEYASLERRKDNTAMAVLRQLGLHAITEVTAEEHVEESSEASKHNQGCTRGSQGYLPESRHDTGESAAGPSYLPRAVLAIEHFCSVHTPRCAGSTADTRPGIAVSILLIVSHSSTRMPTHRCGTRATAAGCGQRADFPVYA